MGKDKNGYTGR
jgi:hypothetical protein